MITNYTPQDLIDFELKVCDAWKNKEIRAPVHLYSNNEEQMIDIFRRINENDWVFCSWRSHYQCLLKGVPQEKLLADIKKGRSISLCYPEYKVFSSAIVTGIIPIATGVAFDISRKGDAEWVWCFVGDMTAETGCFHENWKYAVNQDLPITFVIEDNGKSVCTETKPVWNLSECSYQNSSKVLYYKYENKYPHAGTGERIIF